MKYFDHHFQMLARADMLMSFMFCYDYLLWLIFDWLIVFISINVTPKYVHWRRWLSVWRLCRRLWHNGLSLCPTVRCGVVTLTAPLCSSVYTSRMYMLSSRWERADIFGPETKWPTFSNTFSPTKTTLLNVFPGIQLENGNVVLGVGWCCLGVPPSAESVMTDHRFIYASPELNSYFTPLYDSKIISLCIIILFSVVWTSFLLLILYVYLFYLSLEIRLCSYYHSYEHFLYPFVLYILILPLFMLHIDLCIGSQGLTTFWC